MTSKEVLEVVVWPAATVVIVIVALGRIRLALRAMDEAIEAEFADTNSPRTVPLI